MYREYRRKLKDAKENDNNADTGSKVKNEQTNPLAGIHPEKQYDEEIAIPASRSEITPDMIERGNQLQTKVDFKVTIRLQMNIKPRKRGAKAPDTRPVYWGDMSRQYPPSVKVVRIFTSSTFTDTKYERNFWMEDAYPKIKSLCHSHGYEFQVVDMRWGVRDQATDDHRGVELCMTELEQCQKLSTGPNFVSLLSHKYGYTSLPREIMAEEFEQLVEAMSTDQKSLLLKWYIRDDNAVPPQYILQSISKLIPDYLSRDQERKSVAKGQWWEASQAIQEALIQTATNILGKDGAMKYIISITHMEVQKGILESKSPEEHCLWFRRTITDLEEQEPNYQLSRFIECLGPDEKWQTSRKLLNDLKTKDIPKVLPEDNIFSYEIPWREKGIDPNDPVHLQYLTKMTDDFTTTMCNRIERAIEEKKESEENDPLYDECLRHIEFCQEKANSVGRDDILQKMKDYILGSSDQPLVIHGPSGIGKTSLMAMAACHVREWTNGKRALIIRFIGTTTESSHVLPFLRSVLQQLKHAQGTYSFAPEDRKQLLREFFQSLNPVKVAVPVVFMFDALDQFDPSDDVRQLYWLPMKLPPNVKVIVSTIEDAKYEFFPRLKGKFHPDNYISVPTLQNVEADKTLAVWFTQNARTVTPEQISYLLSCFRENPLPIYLKLVFDEASRWTSYDKLESVQLEKTVRASVMKLFEYLEESYGKVFVSHALGLLTLARNGLSEAELDDVLSCDDDVLNDVYIYWTPPIRRLPPLLLVRLKSFLTDKRYLVERGSDGVRCLNWYHRQFREAAQDRYCQDGDVVAQLHCALAEFFSGTWAEGKKKPFKDVKGNSGEEDRRVSSQPLMLGDTYNFRKLNNLPYHRTLAGHTGKLRDECLMHFEFLMHKLRGVSIRDINNDFDLAVSKFPDDTAIKSVRDAVRLSEKALAYDPLSFGGQLISRLGDDEGTRSLVKQCYDSQYPFLVSDMDVQTKPGGDLKYVLTGHDAAIQAVVMDKSGTEVATVSYDNTLRLWDVVNGIQIRKINGVGQTLSAVSYINDYSALLVTGKGTVVAVNKDGDNLFTINTSLPGQGDPCFCVAGPRDDVIAVLYKDKTDLYDAESGTMTSSIPYPEIMTRKSKFGTLSKDVELISSGSAAHVALTNNNKNLFTILNLNEKTFRRVVYPFKDAEDPEDRVIDYIVTSRDDQSVIVANAMTFDLVFYDINMLTVTRTFTGCDGFSFSNLRLTLDGRYLCYGTDKNIAVVDLHTEKIESILQHRRNVTDVCTVDRSRFATITGEKSLLVWVPVTSTTETKTSAVHGLTVDFICMPNARYVVLLTSKENQQVDVYYIQVYDIVTQDIVRQTLVDNGKSKENRNVKPRLYGMFEDRHILVSNSQRRLLLLELDTMQVTQTFEGEMNKSYPRAKAVCDNQIVSIDNGGRRLNLFRPTSPKVQGTLDLPEDLKLRVEEFQCNTHGELLVAELGDCKNCCIYSARSRDLLSVINFQDFGFAVNCSYALVSPGDTTVTFTSIARPDGYKDLGKDTKTHFLAIVWDRQKGRRSHQLFDRYDDVKYHIINSKKGVSAHEMRYLDDVRIATSHFDGIIRVWDTSTGELIRRLEGHEEASELYCHPGGPYFLSYNMDDEEDAFRLWDTDTLECITTHSLDETQWKTTFLKTGLSFVTRGESEAPVLHWTVHGTEYKEQLDTLPELFPNIKTDLVTNLLGEEKQKVPES